MLIDQPKLAKVFAALDVLRDVLPELAVILPDTAIMDGLLVASLPAVEQGLEIIFEAASVALTHSDEYSARQALVDAIQQKAQAALDAKFGGGGG